MSYMLTMIYIGGMGTAFTLTKSNWFTKILGAIGWPALLGQVIVLWLYEKVISQ